MAVTRKQAEKYVAEFNDYFDLLTYLQQQDFYGGKRSSITTYERCNQCGTHYSSMRPFRNGDCPDGCTIGPIIQDDA